MVKIFEVTNDIRVEVLGPDEAEDPLIYIKAEDHPEDQVIVVFAREIRPLVAALTEAAVWLADQVGEASHDST